MFDPAKPLFLRALSGFHGWPPFLLVFLVLRLEYDRRAFAAWTGLATTSLLASFVFLPRPTAVPGMTPVNVDYVWGLSDVATQTWMHPWAWLALLVFGLPLLVTAPAHLLLRRVVPRKGHPAHQRHQRGRETRQLEDAQRRVRSREDAAVAVDDEVRRRIAGVEPGRAVELGAERRLGSDEADAAFRIALGDVIGEAGTHHAAPVVDEGRRRLLYVNPSHWSDPPAKVAVQPEIERQSSRPPLRKGESHGPKGQAAEGARCRRKGERRGEAPQPEHRRMRIEDEIARRRLPANGDESEEDGGAQDRNGGSGDRAVERGTLEPSDAKDVDGQRHEQRQWAGAEDENDADDRRETLHADTAHMEEDGHRGRERERGDEGRDQEG